MFWRRFAAGVAAGAAILLFTQPLARAAETQGRVTTITRLARIFLEKERAIATAVSGGDKAALEHLVAEDFELRSGANAAKPVPRAEWIDNVMKTRDPGGEISGMAVHDFGPVAVASFTLDARTGNVFVVDVWRGSGSDWKLQVRYASPAGTTDALVPGAGSTEKEIPKKY